MAKSSTPWNRSIPACARGVCPSAARLPAGAGGRATASAGFTIVELLLALTITVMIGGAALAVALSTQGMFALDQARMDVNQNLRSGMDLLGIDVRQAGERMPWDAPALELIDGASGAPDQLILRRNLLDYVLPMCKDINSGSSADSIFVARKKITGRIPQGCAEVPDLDGDGWPDNMQEWRQYRLDNGGEVLAYIYNPVTAQGEFFVYDDEDNSTFHLHKANGDPWLYDYDVEENSRIYIIEQREYRLVNHLLQCVINGDTANALNLVNHIEDFQGRALFQDGSSQASLGPSDPWTDLAALEITLDGRVDLNKTTMDRTLTTQFFPRNILSN